jgi:hypothetical protein
MAVASGNGFVYNKRKQDRIEKEETACRKRKGGNGCFSALREKI